MKILSQSPSVHGFINQPFHLTYFYPYLSSGNREEIAYQRIWESYQHAKEQHQDKTITLILKCMARNLGIGQQIKRFLRLVDRVLLLIRNPYLSIDSLLKMQVISIENMPEASQYNFDTYALKKGFIDKKEHEQHWQILKNFILKTKNHQLITGLLIETLAFIELNQYEIDIVNDYKYRFNHDDNSSKNVFALSWTGWDNMSVIFDKYISVTNNYLVVDSTILRSMPEYVCRQANYVLDITYSPQMLHNWKVVKEKIMDNTIIKTSWMKDCFYKATNATEIKLPTESPISIDLFPRIYQSHILNTAYPSYFSLLKSNSAIRPDSYDEIQELLNTNITKDGKKLKHIDPIFAETLLLLSQGK